MGRARRCIVLGGGGHARVVIDSVLSRGDPKPMAILDCDPSLRGKTLLDVPILGGDELLPRFASQGKISFIVGLGGVGDNRPRARLFDKAIRLGLEPLTVIHPTSSCSRWAKIGRGCALLAGSIVNAYAILHDNVIVNSGAIVEHDCVLGHHVHVATGARLASTVRVGKLAHIGAGATVRQGIRIGEGAVVGAGAVVVCDVPSWTVVVGVPAKALKPARQRASV